MNGNKIEQIIEYVKNNPNTEETAACPDSVSQLGAHLNVSKKTIYTWIQRNTGIDDSYAEKIQDIFTAGILGPIIRKIENKLAAFLAKSGYECQMISTWVYNYHKGDLFLIRDTSRHVHLDNGRVTFTNDAIQKRLDYSKKTLTGYSALFNKVINLKRKEIEKHLWKGEYGAWVDYIDSDNHYCFCQNVLKIPYMISPADAPGNRVICALVSLENKLRPSEDQGRKYEVVYSDEAIYDEAGSDGNLSEVGNLTEIFHSSVHSLLVNPLTFLDYQTNPVFVD